MTPHRRRCLTKAILEIKGALSVTDELGNVTPLTSEDLLLMSNAEILALFIELEKAFDSANITEPMPTAPIEAKDTIVMEAVTPKKR